MFKSLYEQELSRHYPGLFVILLDQSSSMSQKVVGYPDGQTKAGIVTRLVNIIIQEMIDRAGFEETGPKLGIRKKYAYLSVLGYNESVKPLLSTVETPIDIPTLALNPRGSVPEKRPITDNKGNVINTRTEDKRFWITPSWGMNTNMTLAFEHARDVVKKWLNQAPELITPELGYQQPRMECFPPVVINVTDGYYNTGGNPRKVVDDICHMRTNNGNVLVFNCHFTTEKKRVLVFPKEVSEVKGIDHSGYGYDEQMFYMSSVIPETLRERASREIRRPVQEGARGIIYNASFEVLSQFLRWGTVQIAPVTQTNGAQW